MMRLLSEMSWELLLYTRKGQLTWLFFKTKAPLSLVKALFSQTPIISPFEHDKNSRRAYSHIKIIVDKSSISLTCIMRENVCVGVQMWTFSEGLTAACEWKTNTRTLMRTHSLNWGLWGMKRAYSAHAMMKQSCHCVWCISSYTHSNDCSWPAMNIFHCRGCL